MKLFWKIFFGAVLLSAACVLLSGHSMISSAFRAQLTQEARAAMEYSGILARVVYAEGGAGVHDLRVMNQSVDFAIVDENGKAVFSSLDRAQEFPFIPGLDEITAGWTVKAQNGKYWLWAASPARSEKGETLFVETVREVTDIYRAQKEQYGRLMKIMTGMSGIMALAAYLLARLLMKDVRGLIHVTRRIAAGEMNVRAVPRGQDEISLLSQNFNVMADRLHEKMRLLREEAERKELFVGAFSHELKTPLTSIIGYADLMRQRHLDEAQQKECAGYIFAEGQRLERLSIRLMELVVLRRHNVRREKTEMRRLLKDAAQSVAPRLAEAGIRLSWQAEEANVRVETDLMRTVFLNLLDNARKAIDGEGRISLRGCARGRDYVVIVRDSGRGMTREELKHIKDAFFMADKSRARSQGGAGLGLAICEEVVKMHGFTLTFRSKIGQGTDAIVTMKGAVE